jgi:hypothetical protein
VKSCGALCLRDKWGNLTALNNYKPVKSTDSCAFGDNDKTIIIRISAKIIEGLLFTIGSQSFSILAILGKLNVGAGLETKKNSVAII